MQDGKKKKEIAEAFGRVITKLRKNSNLSARSVSYGINMSKTTILLAEQGKLNPQLSTFCKIADAFYKRPDELMKMVIEELPEGWKDDD